MSDISKQALFAVATLAASNPPLAPTSKKASLLTGDLFVGKCETCGGKMFQKKFLTCWDCRKKASKK